jgi:hypothetical protein
MFRIHRAAIITALSPYNQPNQQRRDVVILIPDPKTDAFWVDSTPWGLLEARMIIEAVGDMVGDWETTDRIYKKRGRVYNLWQNHGTQQEAWVRVDHHFRLPPTMITRLKSTLQAWTRTWFPPKQSKVPSHRPNF